MVTVATALLAASIGLGTPVASPPNVPGSALAATEANASQAIAVAGFIVRVKAGTAVLELACHNQRCEGIAKLVAQFPREGERTREVLIGRAPFALPPETQNRFRIRLNRTGRRLMRRVKASGRYALFTGQGVRSRTVLLKRVREIPPR
jgi:hypothetical protein